MNWPERVIFSALLVIGICGLLACPVLFFSTSHIESWHLALLGEPLLTSPILLYLIRSLSMFYVLSSLFTLALARNLHRYRVLIQFWSFLAIVKGIVMLSIDQQLPFPGWWTLIEGPSSICLGSVMLLLSPFIQSETPKTV